MNGTPRETIVSQGLLDQAQPFPDTFAGAARAGEYAAKAVADGGMPWAADRAALAAYLEALWLLRNGHQQGPIFVMCSYTHAHRVMVVHVGDVGRMLPEADVEDPELARRDPLLAALAERVGFFDAAVTESGRVLLARFQVRGGFVVRSSWQRHPRGPVEYQYEDFDELAEARAWAAARGAATSIGTVRGGYTMSAVHLQRPGDEDSAWTRIEPDGTPAPAGVPELALEEVAELTKAAMRAASFDWAERGEVPPQDLMGLLRAAMPAVRLTEGAARQFAQSVLAAKTPPGPVIRDPHLALVALAHSHSGMPLLGLHEQLAAAWATCQDEMGQAVPDSFKDQELATELTLAECYHLIARDPHTGQLRIAADLGALGSAGALIAECLLAGHLRLGEDSCLAATGADIEARVSQPARELAATVEAEGPIEIGKWLQYLALKAPADLGRALLDADVLRPAATPTRRLFSRAEPAPVPAESGLVPRILSHVLGPTRAPQQRRIEAAVLLALARASGLDRADRDTAWWLADTDKDIAGLLEQAGADLPLLIEHVTTAVTTAVATGRR